MIVKDDQNIFDVALEKFGTLENVFTLIKDNGLSFNSKLTGGQELTINNEGVGDSNIKNFATLQKVTFNNNQGVTVPQIGTLIGDFNEDFNSDSSSSQGDETTVPMVDYNNDYNNDYAI